jgi:hypothetical protein
MPALSSTPPEHDDICPNGKMSRMGGCTSAQLVLRVRSGPGKSGWVYDRIRHRCDVKGGVIPVSLWPDGDSCKGAMVWYCRTSGGAGGRFIQERRQADAP